MLPRNDETGGAAAGDMLAAATPRYALRLARRDERPWQIVRDVGTVVFAFLASDKHGAASTLENLNTSAEAVAA